MLQKLDISATLMGHLACMQTYLPLPYLIMQQLTRFREFKQTTMATATVLNKGLMSRTMATHMHYNVLYLYLLQFPRFSFTIALTVINKVNDLRISRDS